LIIAFSVLCLAFIKRDLHSILYAIGMLSNEVLCKVAKKLIKAPRPPTHPSLLVSSHGMPSNHAQFMFFMTAYFALFVRYRLSPRHYSSTFRFLAPIFMFVFSTIVCYTRIYLEFHYMGQIFMGALVGIIFGSFWFFLVHVICTPWFPWIVNSKIGTQLMLQDFTNVPNVFTVEYNTMRQYNRNPNKRHKK
uniref:Dolichyldiphosphatase n=1 Tax=Rodentolepis nana TaxID=102285 RepID=A0A0R3T9Q2_RODNA